MKRKRILAVLMTVMMAGGLLAGCGGKDTTDADKTADEETKKVSLTVWGHKRIRQHLKDMMKEF